MNGTRPAARALGEDRPGFDLGDALGLVGAKPEQRDVAGRAGAPHGSPAGGTTPLGDGRRSVVAPPLGGLGRCVREQNRVAPVSPEKTRFCEKKD